jgi:hypothetical protein
MMSGEPLAHRRLRKITPSLCLLEAEPPVYFSLLRKGRAFPLIVAAEPYSRVLKPASQVNLTRMVSSPGYQKSSLRPSRTVLFRIVRDGTRNSS